MEKLKYKNKILVGVNVSRNDLIEWFKEEVFDDPYKAKKMACELFDHIQERNKS